MFRGSKRLIVPLLLGTVGFGLARAALLTEATGSKIALGAPSSDDGTKQAVAVPSELSSESPFQPALIATIHAQDSTEDGLSQSTPKFSFQGFTPDGTQLLIYKHEVGKRINSFSRELITTFEIVDLNGGKSQEVMKIQADASFSLGSPASKANPLARSTSTTTHPDNPWLFFDPATDAAPPKDVLKSLTPGALSGRAVYVEDVPLSGTGDNTRWGTFVTLRRFGGNLNAVQTYAVESNGSSVFLPQWSPDGNRVLLKVGTQGDSISTFLIYLWNPQQGRIEQGPKEQIAYLQPRWSPDSARIAYVVGGDISGNNGFLARVPTSLHVYDVASKQSRKLVTQVSGPPVSLAQFQWQNANSLLYAAYSVSTAKQVAPVDKSSEPRPAIFEIAATGGAPKLVVKDAFRPMPSPDGKWLAFFGWANAENEQEEQKTNPPSRFFGPRLFLWDRQTKKRFLIQPNTFGANLQMIWTPDSHKLVLLQSSYDSKAAQGTARISALAVQ